MIKKLLLLIAITTCSLTFSQEQYYFNVDLTLTGLQLKDELATKIIATHTRVLDYTSNNGPDVWDACKATDENTSNTDEVVLFYGWEEGRDQDDTNDRTRDKDLQDAGGGDAFVWNREHVFPKSLANPVLDTDIPGPSTDAHHLRAADRIRNSTRNNRKYGRGSGNSDFSSIDFFNGLSGPNTAAWYPGDEWKGDAARMIMYMYVRYGDVCLPSAVGVGSSEFTPDDMIDLFLTWNAEDPVSDIEIARNNYHEDTRNYAAQGNRNPFIDNPYLATRIWGGTTAEDRWGLYSGSDTEAPTTPTNVTLSNINLTSIDISWTASTDNVQVSGYNVYVNDVLTAQTSNTSTTINNLNTNTTYSFTVTARDIINNISEASTAVNGTTLQDTEAPTTPTNIVISNTSDSSFKVSWSASTDNNAVAGYEVYIDGNLIASTTDLFYTVTGLNTSTTYAVEVLAKDIDNNKSSKSATVNTTTTDGSSNGVTELFISEYVEPNTAAGGNNKVIEIVNLSSATISLAGYSIQKQSNGGSWVNDFKLDTGDVTSIIPNDVFVITHADASNEILLAERDLVGPPNNDTNNFGSPFNFNGNDPVGLFKNGVLIDIIGEEGNSSDHIKDKTYRRKSNISVPNSTFTLSEWDALDITYDGIGSHTSTLSTQTNVFQSFKMFPNPANGNNVYFSVTEDAIISVYNVLGKLIQSTEVTKSKNNIDISNLSKGVYLLKINSGKQFITKKLIKN
ncbi:Por secretion system C-terminal sorting domain-containing protein [Polaribacter sp. KT25b]|uniref:endonuclease n=1 Tax=Polaribacter sp. KT25b TaxID=1855336 RepID=UPI00087CB7AC|nr:endonuclease [Polaribacter sp. KT25b]SDR83624.1 Por secretion system C-terminal sorting domain-containing protein [Polaribacter sp. KT25b]